MMHLVILESILRLLPGAALLFFGVFVLVSPIAKKWGHHEPSVLAQIPLAVWDLPHDANGNQRLFRGMAVAYVVIGSLCLLLVDLFLLLSGR